MPVQFIEELTQTMWILFDERKQTEDRFQEKKRLKQKLEKMLRDCHYSVSIYLFGSTVSKLGLRDADMDLVVVTNQFPNQKQSKKLTIKNLYKILDVYFESSCSKVVPKLTKPVPIVKIKRCQCMGFKFDIDINIDHVNSYRMSHLFWYYSQIDDRFCAMVVYLKILIDEKFKQEIIPSSSIALLVLYFLQCGIQPSVLPNLQSMRSDLFGPTIPVENLTFTLDLQDWWEIQKLKLHNKKFIGHEDTPVGIFMFLFFHYYTMVDLTKVIISVRDGSKIKRPNGAYLSEKSRRRYNCPIYLQDPYGKKANVARSVTPSGYALLMNLFKSRLDECRNQK